MLLDANLPKFLWPLALRHAAYLKERSPAKRLKGKTPYELWHGKKPDLSHLKVFGSVAYFGSKPAQSEKFASRGLRGRFVGYDSDAIIHLIWIEGTREVRRERNVIVHEDCRPYSGHKDQAQDELDQELGPQPGLQQDRHATFQGATGLARDAQNTASHTPQREIGTQNSPRERELDEPHELNSGASTSADNSDYSARELNTPVREPSRSRTGSVINVALPPEQEPRGNPRTDPTPDPETHTEAGGADLEVQPRRRSTRPNMGRPPERFDPTFLATIAPKDQHKALACVRDSMALTGTPKERFYTLYTAILDEVNNAHRTFYSYLDEAMEQAATVANTAEEPGLNDPEPKSFVEAIRGPESEQWKKATDAEMEQHEENGTFELVKLPPGHKALDGKWVLKIKRNAKNKIVKYKARYVARGFMQQYGIDYDQTYARVVKVASVRAIFALAALYDHDIVQLDFVTAYLNSQIEEEIYMKQPTGYVQTGKEHLVCKVKKGLYGLKQSARAWAKRLTKFLATIGFRPLSADNNVFVKGDIRTGLTMTVYVDDIKLIGSNKQAMKQVIEELSAEFKVTNLGNPTRIH